MHLQPDEQVGGVTEESSAPCSSNYKSPLYREFRERGDKLDSVKLSRRGDRLPLSRAKRVDDWPLSRADKWEDESKSPLSSADNWEDMSDSPLYRAAVRSHETSAAEAARAAVRSHETSAAVAAAVQGQSPLELSTKTHACCPKHETRNHNL